MPDMMADLNRFAAKHIAVLMLALAMALGASVATGAAYLFQIADVATANETRSSGTQSQLDAHLKAEDAYRSEVRQLMREISGNLASMQADIAVLRERSEQ